MRLIYSTNISNCYEQVALLRTKGEKDTDKIFSIILSPQLRGENEVGYKQLQCNAIYDKYHQTENILLKF